MNARQKFKLITNTGQIQLADIQMCSMRMNQKVYEYSGFHLYFSLKCSVSTL